ncbi:hypothetical protein COCON_G00094960 [Conger conger]|uniref:Uncharacterized protein n=1 Tax=Conger conger TaxID=82655 RepID=A0A9Q1DLX0_CONCO|nr:hypothetical protein COCON_G00094960 [Conger conger]
MDVFTLPLISNPPNVLISQPAPSRLAYVATILCWRQQINFTFEKAKETRWAISSSTGVTQENSARDLDPAGYAQTDMV